MTRSERSAIGRSSLSTTQSPRTDAVRFKISRTVFQTDRATELIALFVDDVEITCGCV